MDDGPTIAKVVFGFYTCNECHLFANLAEVKFVEVATLK